MRSNLRYPIFWAMIVLSTLGCATNMTQHEPSASQAQLPPTPRDSSLSRSVANTVTSSLLRPGRVSYVSKTVSIIQALTGDSIPRVDSVTVNARITMSLSSNQSETIQGILTTDSIIRRINSTLPDFPENMADTVLLSSTGDKIVRQSTTAVDCGEHTQTVVRVDDLLPLIPRQSHLIWTDTLDREVCQAGIRLHAHQITRYQADSTTFPSQLIRNRSTTFTGNGSQWNQPVSISGQSTSTDTLVIDRVMQRLVSTHGAHDLELNFQSKFRQQQFKQSTTIAIRVVQ